MKGQFALAQGQHLLRKNVRRVAEGMILPRASEIEETRELPSDIKDLLRKSGFVGFAFPKEFRGSSGDVVSFCLLLEELSRASADVAMWCAHTYLGALPIILAGSELQKQRYLPEIASGSKMCAFALMEQNAGADPSEVETTAVLRGDEYILNGVKRFVACGHAADHLAVFASAQVDGAPRGTSCFLVDKGTPGLRVTKIEKKMGLQAVSSTELALDNCAVGQDRLIGNHGDGAGIAAKVLELARPLMAAVSIGIGQASMDRALAYAKERVQFGQPIAQFGGIQSMFGEMAIQLEAARMLTYRAAALQDDNDPSAATIGSMAKCLASDAAMKIASEAVQIHGGYGYFRDLPVERYMREAKYTQIAAGTNWYQRRVVAQEMLRDY